MELLNKPEIVKPQDQLHLFIYLYRNPKLRTKVGKWLTENWEYVRNLAGDKSLDSYPRYMANVIRTEGEYKMWRDFFKSMQDDPALSRAIKIGEKEIKARLKLVAADKKAVYQALNDIM